MSLKNPAKRRRRLWWTLAALLLALIAVRAWLPIWVRDYVNETLDAIDGYDGHIVDVDLHLWRGAYEIEGLDIVKTGGDVPVPFFSTPQIDLSVRWSALLHGALVGEIVLTSPRLNFVAGPAADDTQTGAGTDWAERARELFPLRIDHLGVRDGEVHFRNFHTQPEVDVYLKELKLVATNLTNSRELSETMVAAAEGRGEVMEGAPLTFDMAFDPYAAQPTFDLNVELVSVELPQINDLLGAYAHVDAEAGRFSLYAELAASGGTFRGYVKPFIEDAEIFRLEEEDEGPFRLAWEAIVDTVGELFESPEEDKVATRIPFAGSVEDPDAGLWQTVVQLLRNAFVKALVEGLEGSVDLDDGAREELLDEQPDEQTNE